MTTAALGNSPEATEAAEVAAALEVDPDKGLNSDEAARRLAESGPNELRASPPEPTWRKVLRQFQEPLVYLLLVAMVISLAAWFVEGATGAPIDAIVIAAIVIANAAIGYVQESRAADAVAALQRMTTVNSTVVRDGSQRSVPSSELVPGDVLVLAEGDAVGADARLLTATGLRVQEASLTGESEASTKNPATLAAGIALGDRANMVFKGTSVVQGVGRAVVSATGMGTQMGSIAEMLDETEADPSPLDREIEQVSKMLGILVLGIAVVVMAALVLVNGADTTEELVTVLLMGVSLAVAAVPEGLPAILSLVLAVGVRTLAGHNALMKELHSVETLGAASVICSDKTGTLTRNEMTLRTVVTASGELDLSGTGYDPDGKVTGEPDDATLREARMALTAGSIANDAQLRKDESWEIQGDPTEAAFLVAQHKLEGTADRVRAYGREGEVPFTSERKLMSVGGREAGTDAIRLFSKGAPDVLLAECDSIQVGDAVEEMDEARREGIRATVEQLAAQGYRTLGTAFRDLSEEDAAVIDDADEHALVWLGVVGIIDPPRTEAANAIREAHRAGIRTIMITGDHPVTAARIASDLGIVEEGARALSGNELDALSDEEFQQATRDVSVFARVAPKHKLRIVDALQADDQLVAMTGDGVNDAPALKSADIGVAMGITGTEVTKEASEMILADDNYATIVTAVRLGRGVYDNIRKFLRYLLSSNMGEVATVFFGVLLAGFIGLAVPDDPSAMAVPLLATQILWINLVTDSGPALAMGVDPEDGDVMGRPPRHPSERILNRSMWLQIISMGLVMGTVTLLTIDIFLPGGLVGGSDSLEVARTAGFTTLVFAQLFNAFNSRSEFHSAFSRPFDNKWLWLTVLLAAALQFAVVELPFLQVAFGTTHLDAAHWLAALGMASIVLWYGELAKLGRRARARARNR
ncbi:cation-translocating P-type ATPase [Tessaracoccus rhinocerotis]|uniref:cation-translocating P-type ATPase n=1 Tax=Tessaracoccus rhinocerotis TaxID=1689449 RepID=UPI00163D80DC|nr:cation-translocating P-type ATPase [Tessaracoccus rhinocerotis]